MAKYSQPQPQPVTEVEVEVGVETLETLDTVSVVNISKKSFSQRVGSSRIERAPGERFDVHKSLLNAFGDVLKVASVYEAELAVVKALQNVNSSVEE